MVVNCLINSKKKHLIDVDNAIEFIKGTYKLKLGDQEKKLKKELTDLLNRKK